MLAILCPGQGSQSPGVLSPWLELPGTQEFLGQLSELISLDLIKHGTVSDAETIKDTAIAQPLIVATSLVSARALWEDSENSPASPIPSTDFNFTLAGHSVGEVTAAAIAGVLSPEAALRFIHTRAQGMAAAAAKTPTGMSAVIGGAPEEVTASILAAGLACANYNGAGQIVAAGSLENLTELTENPPSKARVIPLAVAGAFHTEYMAPAVPALIELAPELHPVDPSVKVQLLSNADGQAITSGTVVLECLISQVTSPVRWDLCMDHMVSSGVTGTIELAPAGTLSGLAKRGMPGVSTLAIKSPEDLDAARELLRSEA